MNEIDWLFFREKVSRLDCVRGKVCVLVVPSVVEKCNKIGGKEALVGDKIVRDGSPHSIFGEKIPQDFLYLKSHFLHVLSLKVGINY